MGRSTLREDVFTQAHRADALKKFTAKAKRLFLSDLTNKEIELLAMEMQLDIANVSFARGFEKKRSKK